MIMFKSAYSFQRSFSQLFCVVFLHTIIGSLKILKSEPPAILQASGELWSEGVCNHQSKADCNQYFVINAGTYSFLPFSIDGDHA